MKNAAQIVRTGSFVLLSVLLPALSYAHAPESLGLNDTNVQGFFSRHECYWQSNGGVAHRINRRVVGVDAGSWAAQHYSLEIGIGDPTDGSGASYEAVGYIGIWANRFSADWAALNTFKIPRNGVSHFESTIYHFYGNNLTWRLWCVR